ncbi:MAG: UDP-3-O-(3-hydroxymyristoyl)glucosamine N-acyltransferase, partial [Candidatus Thorarchaeota archaeon]|nr:UDP-3-O-(3-hydroxymyristoyl)glucosamine N-acyltransferase [Candidatus Thorarchaeota archaeon]
FRDGEFRFLAKLNNLVESDSLAFLSDERFLVELDENMVSCVITDKQIASKLIALDSRFGILIAKKPREVFFQLHELLVEDNYYYYDFDSEISGTAEIAESAYVAKKNVKIGDRSVVYPNATIHENVIIGSDCLIESGVVLGCQGFEVDTIAGKKKVIKHGGKTIIGNDVIIKSNSSITKGLFPTKNTIIGDNVICNNLVQIDHGSVIGSRTLIGSCAMISGNVRIGNDVWIGPSAAIVNGITIGDNCWISLGSVVTKNVEADRRVSGNFAIDHEKFIQFIKSIR